MFKSKLVLQYVDGTNWLTFAPLVWQDPDLGEIYVPTDFSTDLASVPHVFNNILPAQGKTGEPYGRSAVIHDYLYATQRFTKEQSDSVLLKCAIADGCSKLVAELLYTGVKEFGHTAWRDDAIKYGLNK